MKRPRRPTTQKAKPVRLTNAMHDAVLLSPVGQYLDRLVRADITANGRSNGIPAKGGNIIQQLWAAFMSGRKSTTTRGH